MRAKASRQQVEALHVLSSDREDGVSAVKRQGVKVPTLFAHGAATLEYSRVVNDFSLLRGDLGTKGRTSRKQRSKDMKQQDTARVGGYMDFNPADMSDTELRGKAGRMQAIRKYWDRTDGVKK